MSNDKKQTENYWVIGTNKWSVDNYTKEEAEMHSRNLINCSNCRNCINCINCSDCRYCVGCRDCHGCIGCSNCRDCIGCSNQVLQINIRR